MSLRTIVVPLALVTLVAPPAAEALIYFGNPQLGFRVDRAQGDYVDGSVYLDKARVHHCGGDYTDYDVSQTVDPVAGHKLTIAGGDHCYVTWYWGGTMTIEGGSGSGAYTLEVYDATTTVTLAEDIDPVALEDWAVVSGTMSDGGPWVLTYVQ